MLPTTGSARKSGDRTLLPSESAILAVARPLVAAGVALHWLRRREKAPIDDGWSKAAVHSMPTLVSAYRSGANLGARLGEPSRTAAGFLHLIDLDIRDPSKAEEARARLRELWPDYETFPSVRSGSGGDSEHRYFTCETPFRSRKLAKSEGFSLVFDPKKGRDVKKYDWEIELFGTGKQAVLPPSVHPDTGNPYEWQRPLDLDLLALGVGPSISPDLVTSWGATEDDLSLDDDEDDFLSLVRTAPMGLTEAEIEQAVADLPDWWVEDRDTWLQVGQALHHEYQGGANGFERWCEWSKRSAKYDVQDQKTVWKSFKGAAKPVRMATILKAAGEARLERAHAPLDDLASLLGGGSTALAVLDRSDAPIDDILSASDSLADLLGPPPTPNAPGAAVAVDPEWRSYLQRTEDGTAIKPTLPNIQLIVRNDIRTRGICGYNAFTQEVVLIREPGLKSLRKESPKPVRQLDGDIWKVRDPVNGDLWNDSHDHALRAIIEAPERQGGYSVKVSDRDLKAALDMVAHEQAFHPVRHYLESVRWDGTPRIERLFIEYLGAEDNAYHRATGRLTMLGAVTRIFEPGHKFDFVPILEGLQGKRKSTFIRVLGKSWFAELDGDLQDTKQLVEKMQGAWILEIPELQGFSKVDVTKLKAFVSTESDKVRMAYERRARNFPRQCIFIGSTNERDYLRDTTGGRRFWPIACGDDEIDTARLARTVDQLWAEAVHVYREMRASRGPSAPLPLYLVDQEAALLASVAQESRRQETPEEMLAGQITEWLNRPIGADMGFEDLDGEKPRYRDQTCVKEIWVDMLGESGPIDERKARMIGRALLVAGLSCIGPRHTTRWGSQRFYRRN